MSPEDLKRLDEASVRISTDIERELRNPNGGPLAYVLAKAKKLSDESLTKLATVDPENPKAIRKLQNEVLLYPELVHFVCEAVREGNDAWRRLAPQERLDLIEPIASEFDDA